MKLGEWSIDSLIDVLEPVTGHPGSYSWITQLTTNPVSLPPGSHKVFLRTFEVSECSGLEQELSDNAIVDGVPTKHRKINDGPLTPPETPSTLQSELPTSSPLSSSISLPSPLGSTKSPLPAESAPPTPNRNLSVFPYQYSVDMDSAFQRIVELKANQPKRDRKARGKETEKVDVVKERFENAFPAAKYVRSTFLKHQAIWLKGKLSGVVEKSVAAGFTRDGLWSAVMRSVQQPGNILPVI
jgi:hypothetical protein